MNRDTVTGTYARTALMERLEEEVQRGLRYGDEFSLLVLDLDHFKSVNDAFGHSRGDAVLAELAARVQAAARASDVLFRYGGDEFVLLLPRTSREQAAALARRLADAIAAAPFAGTPPLSLGASVGVAAFPEDGSTATALFDRADARMFQAKRGGGRVVARDIPQRLGDALDGTGRLVERAGALEHGAPGAAACCARRSTWQRFAATACSPCAGARKGGPSPCPPSAPPARGWTRRPCAPAAPPPWPRSSGAPPPPRGARRWW
jgi:diguanylate cyclase (GGDEF)-like protein